MKNLKKIITLLMVLLMLSCTQSIAGDINLDLASPPASTPAAPAHTGVEALAASETLETTVSPEAAESSSTAQPDETTASGSKAETDLPTDGPASEATTEPTDVIEENPEAAAETPEIGIAAETSAMNPFFSVSWELVSAKGTVRVGDKITLQAEIVQEATGLHLQWQAATKPANKLKEDEPEWADIPGAQGEKYTFKVTEGMQDWRWRLCIDTSEGETLYSDEMTLPEVTEPSERTKADDQALDVEDVAVLPVGTITVTADVPPEEITYGTKISLVAEIENPQEGMLLQWQHRPADAGPEEEAWQDIDGATNLVYSFVLDEENAGWLWRLLITMPEAVEEHDEGISTVNETIVEEESASDVAEPPMASVGEEDTMEEGTHPIDTVIAPEEISEEQSESQMD